MEQMLGQQHLCHTTRCVRAGAVLLPAPASPEHPRAPGNDRVSHPTRAPVLTDPGVTPRLFPLHSKVSLGQAVGSQEEQKRWMCCQGARAAEEVLGTGAQGLPRHSDVPKSEHKAKVKSWP